MKKILNVLAVCLSAALFVTVTACSSPSSSNGNTPATPVNNNTNNNGNNNNNNNSNNEPTESDDPTMKIPEPVSNLKFEITNTYPNWRENDFTTIIKIASIIFDKPDETGTWFYNKIYVEWEDLTNSKKGHFYEDKDLSPTTEQSIGLQGHKEEFNRMGGDYIVGHEYKITVYAVNLDSTTNKYKRSTPVSINFTAVSY